MISRRNLYQATAASLLMSATIGRKAGAQQLMGNPRVDIDRAFVRIREGLVHYHHAGESTQDGPLPLYMMHASPGSSKSLVSLISMLGGTRRVIAGDTLGYGDSAPPEPEVPDLAYYADSVVRVMDALELDKVDVYGSHTGANIGIELVIARPDRIRKLVFDGVALFGKDFSEDLLANYAPEITPDADGGHFVWAWNYLRDMSMFFPHYRRDPEHYLGRPVRSPQEITNSAVEVLKALPHYYKGYRAVFRHPTHDRLPLITVPTFCMAHEADPLHMYVEEAASLVPNSTQLVLPRSSGATEKAEAILAFLDSTD